MLLYLGTSWSTVSLGSIQTVESLHTKSISNRRLHQQQQVKTAEKVLQTHSVSLDAGESRGSGDSTASLQRENKRSRVRLGLQFSRRSRRAATHRGTGKSTLTWVTRLARLTLFQRQTRTKHLRVTPNQHHTEKTKRFYQNPFIQSALCCEEVIPEFLTSSPFFPGGPAGPRGPMGP